MPIVTSTGTVAQSEDDTAWDNRAVDYRNNSWMPPFGQVVWGVFESKSGDVDFIGGTMRFTNMSPAVPSNAKIVSAVMRGTAAGADAGTVSTLIEVLAQDGLWEITPTTPAQWNDIDTTVQTANFRVEVRDTAATVMTTSDIGTGNNFEWELRKVVSPGRYERLGQSMTIETDGNLTLGEIDWTIGKVGLPTGLIFLELYDLDGNGHPDTLLATSDTVDVSTISATTGVHTFVFSGGQQYGFSSSEQFAVVIRGDWTIDDTNYIACRYKMPGATQGGYDALGHALTFGVGAGFDDQHYPGDQNLFQIASAHPSVFVSWSPPTFVADVEYTTPDFANLIQAYVNLPAYSEGDPFAVQIFRLTAQATDMRKFKAFDHPDTPGVSNQIALEVQWKERAIRVST